MKKVFAVALVLLNLLFIGKVNAASETNEYIKEGEEIPGVYYYKHRNDTDDIKYEFHNFHKQATVYRTSISNQIVYCVESWEPLTGAKENDYKRTSNYKETKLTEEQHNKILEYAYYGYGYKENGIDHTDLKWYAITQYLIWKVQAPNIEHYFVSSISSTTPIYPFEEEIKEMENLIQSEKTFPYFINSPEEVLKGDTFEIVDIYNKMSGMTLNYSSGLTVNQKNQNTLNVTVNKNTSQKEYVEFTKIYPYYNHLPYYYISDTYQDCLLPGMIQMKRNKVEFRIVSGQISVNIQLFNLKTKRWKFVQDLNVALYDKDTNELIASSTTNENGDAYFKYLPKGNYYYEIEELEGYKKIPRQELSLTKENYLKSFYHVLEQQRLNIKINTYKEIFDKKDDKYEYDYIEESNSEIGIYDENDKLITTLKTNEDGTINKTIDTYYGNYYIKQISCDSSHIIDDTKYYFNFKKVGDSDIQYVEFNIFNELPKSNIKIIKKDEDTLNRLSNVTFNILNEDKEVIESIKTDELGEINILLPFNKYYIKEIKGLIDYIVNNEVIELDANKEEIEVIITNKKENKIIEKEEVEIKEEAKEEINMEEEIKLPTYEEYQEEIYVDKTDSNNYNYMYILTSIIALLMILCKRHLFSYL